ncbi:hypothetical protein EYF80_043672 [Liparis tanakae]|uniref:Uncharacterized protein n=1 Tax=Liparis tanakae TaxID=230148 RepID=A0A4Z2FXV6_9TELE|nr:hypothetical protein EYF80_043672 [Liparis tanakae]
MTASLMGSFDSERAKRAAPAASINRWKAPFSAPLIALRAALLGSGGLASTQPSDAARTEPPASAAEPPDP